MHVKFKLNFVTLAVIIRALHVCVYVCVCVCVHVCVHVYVCVIAME